jgi:hypothetical protein
MKAATKIAKESTTFFRAMSNFPSPKIAFGTKVFNVLKGIT